MQVEPGQRVITATIRGGALRLPYGDAFALGFPGIHAAYVPWQALHLPGVETIVAAGLIVAGIRRPIPDPIPLFAGLAVPLDLWGWFNGQPLAQVEIVPAAGGELPGGGVWIDPISGAAIACCNGEEMDPVNEAADTISGGR